MQRMSAIGAKDATAESSRPPSHEATKPDLLTIAAIAKVPVHFVIADGIVTMEGNGPLNGSARPLGKIVVANDPVAADATCARLMGFEPARIMHICEGSKFLGNASPALIDQVGETVNAPATPFQLVPEFRHLHTKGVWL
jgi:uncharacterized protein (DUF362 family)